jgi:hypothetical protein
MRKLGIVNAMVIFFILAQGGIPLFSLRTEREM